MNFFLPGSQAFLSVLQAAETRDVSVDLSPWSAGNTTQTVAVL